MRKYYLVSACIFLIAVIPRLAMALSVYGQDVGDMPIFRLQADTTLLGGMPYTDLPYADANYPPFWTLYMTVSLRVWGILLNISFDFMLKMLIAVVDGMISLLIYLVLLEQNIESKIAFLWSMLYALNPLVIYNSSFYGQIDSLPIGFSFIAALMAVNAKYRWLPLGALMLGLAISIKTYPIMFLPFLLWETIRRYGWKWNKIASVMALVWTPMLLQLIPLLLAGQTEILSRLLFHIFLQSGTGGLGHTGFLGVVKWIGFPPIAGLTAHEVDVPQSWGLIGALIKYVLTEYRLLLLTKLIFGAAYLLVVARGRRLNLISSMLLTLMMIFAFVGGFFAYYLMWPLPFATLLQKKLAIVYTISGWLLIALAHPAINFLFWAVCLMWTTRTILEIVHTKPVPSAATASA